jgi:hypothetical protein
MSASLVASMISGMSKEDIVNIGQLLAARQKQESIVSLVDESEGDESGGDSEVDSMSDSGGDSDRELVSKPRRGRPPTGTQEERDAKAAKKAASKARGPGRPKKQPPSVEEQRILDEEKALLEEKKLQRTNAIAESKLLKAQKKELRASQQAEKSCIAQQKRSTREAEQFQKRTETLQRMIDATEVYREKWGL